MSIISNLRSLTPMARRLVAMRFLTHVGMLSSYFIGILGTLTYSLGGDALSTTFAVGLLNLAIVIGEFVGGAVLDALGPRRHFVLCVGVTCVSAILFQFFSSEVFEILICSMIFGAAWGLGEAIVRSYPAYLTADSEELGRINSALSAVSNVSVVVGPLLGGAIASAVSTRAVFLLAAVMSVAGLVVARAFHPQRDPHVEQKTEDAAEDTSLLAGFKVVAAAPTLRLLLAVGFLTFFGYGAFDPLESLFYRDVLCVGVEWMGWLSSASGIGAILGAMLMLRMPSHAVNMKSLLIALFALGAGCLVYVGTPFVGVAFAGQICLGVAFGLINPLENTLVQMHTPLATVGRVSAVMSFGYNAAGVVPLFMAPWLAEVLGVQQTLIAASALVTVFPLICMVVLRRRLNEA